MGEWRRPKGPRKRDSDRWGLSATTTRTWSHPKPPRFPDEKTDMHWEEKFCENNGVSWRKLLDTKKFLPQYSDITGWDDSAGKEAFENAKARYWAQINGLQPEMSLPDPDLLIDIVDHDAPPSDVRLYENLRGSLSDVEGDDNDSMSDDGWGDGGVILWDSHYAKTEKEEEAWGNIPTGWGEGQPIIPTGWGDIPMQPTVQYDGWGAIPVSWGDNSPTQTRWADVAGDANPGTTYEGIVPTGWGEVEAGPRGSWNGGVTDANYWNCGVNEGNWGGWSQNNGYDHGTPVEAGQYWNYGGNYWNSGGLNPGNWNNYNYNQHGWNYSGEQRGYKNGWNRNGAGRSKHGNKNYGKGKEWKRKEDSSRNFCAPLNQSNQNNDGWNVPRSVA